MPVKYTSAEKAVKEIKSGNRVFVHGSAATPLHLLRALFERKNELKNVELVCITTLGDGIFDIPDFGKSFFINSLFVSENTREIVNSNDGCYVPVFLSEIPLLFKKNILPVDVALIHVSPPDKHGYCSLGTSVDVTVSAIQNAHYVIAQVNPQMPRTHGDGIIHIGEINALVEINELLPEVNYNTKTNADFIKIGQFCAELIEDRSTLQMGIGGIPNAVLSCLQNHKDLGIHTEMFSDGILPLIEKGIINNKFKNKHGGKIVTSFALGSRK
jgi:acyl-CoA hydrolase